MNVEKQIAYWRTGSGVDFEVAGELVANRRLLHGLFFAHLAVEKMLKAHVVKATKNLPPKLHNLVRLSGLANLEAPENVQQLFRRLNAYQLEGRYPDAFENTEITAEGTALLMRDAKEALEWLTQRL